MRRGKWVAAVVGLGAGVAAPLASADSNPQKDQCKHGGFANVRDNNGAPFKNQGQCIKFVNGGGTLQQPGGSGSALL